MLHLKRVAKLPTLQFFPSAVPANAVKFQAPS
jgi:hypothetical protein